MDWIVLALVHYACPARVPCYGDVAELVSKQHIRTTTASCEFLSQISPVTVDTRSATLSCIAFYFFPFYTYDKFKAIHFPKGMDKQWKGSLEARLY